MMRVSTIIIRNLVAIMLLLGGIYLSISAIIALPILEDEASFKKEDFYAMNVDVDTQRNQSIRFIKEMNLDPSTLLKYDSVSVLLGSQKRSETIRANVSRAKTIIITNLVDQSDRCKQMYNSVSILGKVRKDSYATELLLQYSQICTHGKQEIFNLIQSVDLQTANLFSIAMHDKSPNKEITRKEKASLNIVFSSVQPQALALPRKQDNYTTTFFIPAGWSLNERSQNLAIITGLLGFALFGSVIGAFSKVNFTTLSSDEIRTEGGIYYDIILYLVKGFSAALVVYLSIKGGLSLITTTNTDKVNPYVILFLCFISAVFSDNIWEWAKTKLITTNSDTKDVITDNLLKKRSETKLENKEMEDQEIIEEVDVKSFITGGTELPAVSSISNTVIAQSAMASGDATSLNNVSSDFISEAIIQKLAEWQAAFGIQDAKPSTKIMPNQSQFNAIKFCITPDQHADHDYLTEIPNVVTVTSNDGSTYNIPIVI